MKPIARWIGLGIGLLTWNPVVAFIGFGIGYYIDTRSGLVKVDKPKEFSSPTDFVQSLLVLTAAVMKADGVVRRIELDYVKAYFLRTFNEGTTASAILMLRDLLKEDVPVDNVCTEVAGNLAYESRLQLLHFLFGISESDGEVHPTELNVIEDIARKMSISSTDYISIRQSFVQGIEAAYDMLGVNETASVEEIKSAYRRMANKYHPDKVAYLGEELKLAAQEKFTRLKEAYDLIKSNRGFM